MAVSPGSTTIVLGGARSGKSRHAEAIITEFPPPWVYLATAQALDDEMSARIALHRARRREGWITEEEPIDLARVLAASGPRPVLVDCLTIWLSNLMLGGHDIDVAMAAVDAALERRRAPTVLVSNEVGQGIVPDNALAREFRDAAGEMNQHFAAHADQVFFLVAGLPMRLK
jgi:adenosylcobinamide kinase/adenosylcobinamide-phosphate guanylyltransferase